MLYIDISVNIRYYCATVPSYTPYRGDVVLNSRTETQDVSPFDLPKLPLLSGYIKLFAGAFVIYTVIWLFWRQYILVDFNTIFTSTVPLGEALWSVRWLFVWPVVFITVLPLILRLLGYQVNDDIDLSHTTAGEVLTQTLFISFCAGIFEELIFRWLSFSVDMVIATFFNWITFGLYKWCMVTIVLPLANWATFGYLQPQLLGSEWVIGAAVVMANANFRSNHTRGIVSKINAWFLGMVFFYMMFHYGILSAIVAHILYDCIVFALMAVIAAFSQR